MEQLLTKDYEDAKNIIGHKLIHNGVQILNLSTQLTTSKTIKKYYKWKFQIIGAKDSFWKHITYDVFIDFHHRHPFTQPRVYFPYTKNNKGNPAHPLVCKETLSLIHRMVCGEWRPTITGITIIKLVASLFAIDVTKPVGFKADLGPHSVTHIISFLTLEDVLRVRLVCKAFQNDVNQEKIWLGLYQRASWINSAVDLGGNFAPIRIFEQEQGRYNGKN